MQVTKIPYADNAYEIRDGNASLSFYIRDCDFPGDRVETTRGELFYVEVPIPFRRKGNALKMTRMALSMMKDVGTTTINISPVSKEGELFVRSLIRSGDISYPIKYSQTGKMEFEIL